MSRKAIATLFIVVISMLLVPAANAKDNLIASGNCTAPSGWFTNTPPGLPAEVAQSAGDGSSTFCDFYQFSWQAFLSLMGTDKKTGNRVFENTRAYPILEFAANGEPANSCDKKIIHATKTTSLNKTQRLQTNIQQAGDNATIYDQNENVVYYDVRFSRNLCSSAKKIASQTNFTVPGDKNPNNNVYEIKTAWRVLSDEDASQYVTITADIGSGENKQKDVLLGLIGFHLAVATPNHPEFVWATFEHRANAPDCEGPASNKGWSFANEHCTQGNDYNCAFNKAFEATETRGNPTEICRVYPYGTDAADANAGENLAAILSMNMSVTKQLAKSDALNNYFNVGALWVSDTAKDSDKTVTVVNEKGEKVQGSDTGNQRGSLRLANTVAETTFQHVDLNPASNSNFASNCFGCHGYAGTADAKNKNTTSGNLSHLFLDVVAGLGQCVHVQAGPIYSQSEAETTCPTTCSIPLGKWNGQWKTTEQNVMSVCGCCAK